MKNNVRQNILIGNDEEIYKEFPKLKGIDYFCQVVITNKRLIIYTQKNSAKSSTKVKKRSMIEIELKSISYSEYSLESKKPFIINLIGFILAIGAVILAYGIYKQIITVPVYQYSEILNFVSLGLVFMIGLVLLLRIKSFLKLKVISGFNITTELKLKPTKYNDLALKYLASKFY